MRYAEGQNFTVDIEEGVAVCRTFKQPNLDSTGLGDAAFELCKLGTALTLDDAVTGMVVDLRRTPGAVGPRVELAYADLAGAWEATAQRISFLILDDPLQQMQISRIVSHSAGRFGAVFTDRNEARVFVGATGASPATAMSRLHDRPSRAFPQKR